MVTGQGDSMTSERLRFGVDRKTARAGSGLGHADGQRRLLAPQIQSGRRGVRLTCDGDGSALVMGG